MMIMCQGNKEIAQNYTEKPQRNGLMQKQHMGKRAGVRAPTWEKRSVRPCVLSHLDEDWIEHAVSEGGRWLSKTNCPNEEVELIFFIYVNVMWSTVRQVFNKWPVETNSLVAFSILVSLWLQGTCTGFSVNLSWIVAARLGRGTDCAHPIREALQ